MSFAPHDGTARLLDSHGQVLATLTRVRFPDLVEEQERVTFRAPYGTTVHVRGRGSIRPPTLRLRGVLQGPATTVDDQLQALQAALRTTNNLWIGDWLIPVRSAGGHITFSPTLNGWAVEVPLLGTGDAWQLTPPVRDGLVAEYRFDEGSGLMVTDYSGNGNHGTVEGAATWTQEGLAEAPGRFRVPGGWVAGANAVFTVTVAARFHELPVWRLGWEAGSYQNFGWRAGVEPYGTCALWASQNAGSGPDPLRSAGSSDPLAWHTYTWVLDVAAGLGRVYRDGSNRAEGSYSYTPIPSQSTLALALHSPFGTAGALNTVAAAITHARVLADEEVALTHGYIGRVLAARGVALP